MKTIILRWFIIYFFALPGCSVFYSFKQKANEKKNQKRNNHPKLSHIRFTRFRCDWKKKKKTLTETNGGKIKERKLFHGMNTKWKAKMAFRCWHSRSCMPYHREEKRKNNTLINNNSTTKNSFYSSFQWLKLIFKRKIREKNDTFIFYFIHMHISKGTFFSHSLENTNKITPKWVFISCVVRM